MFNRNAYENSRPDGIGVLEIVPQGEPERARPRQFVPLRRTELQGEVVGPLASLRLTQSYRYSHDQCDRVLEAVYRFPLPGDAAVTSVLVRFGDVEIQAELKERQEAEADYREAKRQGKQASLLTRESPDVFTLQISGLQPDQEVTVETHYVQLARAEGSGWSLRIPLTTAPRYVRGDESESRYAQGQPLLLLRDPGHRFSLDLVVQGNHWVESSTHQLQVTDGGDRVRVRLAEGEVVPDRDCVLRWRPQQVGDRPTLQVWLHQDAASAQLYVLALVSPPPGRAGAGVPREAVMLVDHSGSMEGPKWEAADWAVKRFLLGLNRADSFALGLFHNTTTWFQDRPSEANASAVEKAIRFLEAHKDSGGTELGVAIEQALDLKRAEGQRARHLLIVTDAQVSDEGRILRLADEESTRADRRRISVLCIDSAPNSLLALELAERGGGVARFLTSSSEEEDISTALDEILADWAEPVLAGLRLEVNRPEAEAAGRGNLDARDRGSSALDLGDLPAGRPLWIVGRVPRGDGPPLAIRVATAEGRAIAESSLDLAEQAEAHPALKALFGARRVLGLETLVQSDYPEEELRKKLRWLGYDPEALMARRPGQRKKLYAENARRDAGEALKSLLVREALDYGLACSETAFVAVRKEAGKLVEGTVPVANALPSGWSESFLTAMAPAPMAAPPTSPSPMGLGLSMAAFLKRRGGGGAGKASYAARQLPPDQAMFPADTELSLAEEAEPEHARTALLFSGTPTFERGEAILFDSAREEDSRKLPGSRTISRLKLRFLKGTPAPGGVHPEVALLVFVDDLSSPRARVRLADLIRQGGERPLNVARRQGQVVRVLLVDPEGSWTRLAAPIEVILDLS